MSTQGTVVPTTKDFPSSLSVSVKGEDRYVSDGRSLKQSDFDWCKADIQTLYEDITAITSGDRIPRQSIRSGLMERLQNHVDRMGYFDSLAKYVLVAAQLPLGDKTGPGEESSGDSPAHDPIARSILNQYFQDKTATILDVELLLQGWFDAILACPTPHSVMQPPPTMTGADFAGASADGDSDVAPKEKEGSGGSKPPSSGSLFARRASKKSSPKLSIAQPNDQFPVPTGNNGGGTRTGASGGEGAHSNARRLRTCSEARESEDSSTTASPSTYDASPGTAGSLDDGFSRSDYHPGAGAAGGGGSTAPTPGSTMAHASAYGVNVQDFSGGGGEGGTSAAMSTCSSTVSNVGSSSAYTYASFNNSNARSMGANTNTPGGHLLSGGLMGSGSANNSGYGGFGSEMQFSEGGTPMYNNTQQAPGGGGNSSTVAISPRSQFRQEQNYVQHYQNQNLYNDSNSSSGSQSSSYSTDGGQQDGLNVYFARSINLGENSASGRCGEGGVNGDGQYDVGQQDEAQAQQQMEGHMQGPLLISPFSNFCRNAFNYMPEIDGDEIVNSSIIGGSGGSSEKTSRNASFGNFGALGEQNHSDPDAMDNRPMRSAEPRANAPNDNCGIASNCSSSGSAHSGSGSRTSGVESTDGGNDGDAEDEQDPRDDQDPGISPRRKGLNSTGTKTVSSALFNFYSSGTVKPPEHNNGCKTDVSISSEIDSGSPASVKTSATASAAVNAPTAVSNSPVTRRAAAAASQTSSAAVSASNTANNSPQGDGEKGAFDATSAVGISVEPPIAGAGNASPTLKDTSGLSPLPVPVVQRRKRRKYMDVSEQRPDGTTVNRRIVAPKGIYRTPHGYRVQLNVDSANNEKGSKADAAAATAAALDPSDPASQAAAALVAAGGIGGSRGKFSRNSKTFADAVWIYEIAILISDNPNTVQEMFGNGNFESMYSMNWVRSYSDYFDGLSTNIQSLHAARVITDAEHALAMLSFNKIRAAAGAGGGQVAAPGLNIAGGEGIAPNDELHISTESEVILGGGPPSAPDSGRSQRTSSGRISARAPSSDAYDTLSPASTGSTGSRRSNSRRTNSRTSATSLQHQPLNASSIIISNSVAEPSRNSNVDGSIGSAGSNGGCDGGEAMFDGLVNGGLMDFGNFDEGGMGQGNNTGVIVAGGVDLSEPFIFEDEGVDGFSS